MVVVVAVVVVVVVLVVMVVLVVLVVVVVVDGTQAWHITGHLALALAIRPGVPQCSTAIVTPHRKSSWTPLHTPGGYRDSDDDVDDDVAVVVVVVVVVVAVVVVVVIVNVDVLVLVTQVLHMTGHCVRATSPSGSSRRQSSNMMPAPQWIVSLMPLHVPRTCLARVVVVVVCVVTVVVVVVVPVIVVVVIVVTVVRVVLVVTVVVAVTVVAVVTVVTVEVVLLDEVDDEVEAYLSHASQTAGHSLGRSGYVGRPDVSTAVQCFALYRFKHCEISGLPLQTRWSAGAMQSLPKDQVCALARTITTFCTPQHLSCRYFA